MLNKPLIYSAITLTSLASLVLSISLFSAPPTAALGSSDDGASLQQTDSGGGTATRPAVQMTAARRLPEERPLRRPLPPSTRYAGTNPG